MSDSSKFTQIKKYWDFFLNIFFPPFCIGCNKEGSLLCPDCFGKIKRYSNPIKKLEVAEGTDEIINYFIIPCPYHKNPILARAVHRMKYTFYKDISKILAELLINALKTVKPNQSTHIVPIPLHKKRKRFRGFNQAEVLANHISAKCGFPITPLLIRTKKTKSQATLHKKERLENLKQAFALNPNISHPPKNTPLLILDDICTTGTTISQAAKVLKKNGYNVVLGAALAYAEIN